jgi:hypothetical protein
MSGRPERAPGDPAPAAGAYEQLNIFGRPNGIRVDMMTRTLIYPMRRWVWKL